jgi:hypothetical protein
MRAACILLGISLAAWAQQPRIDEAEAAHARRLLSSAQWLDRAWGAYFAGRLPSAELREPILDALREAAALRDTTGVTGENGYLAALFDAAIESGIAVPPAVLQPFEEHWQARVIILLARDPDSEESLLRMREETLTGPEWLAVSNQLLALKSQRFFAKTLSEVNIAHHFTLADPGDGSEIGGGSGGGTWGLGFGAMPRGFPPIGIYALVDSPREGDVMLAGGPKDVYYRRFIVPTNRQVTMCTGDGVDRPKLRIEYLAPLGKLTEGEAEYLFHQQTRIEFRGDDDLHRRWDSALDAHEAAIRSFVRTAQGHGLGDVTGMRLHIDTEIDDLRKTTRGALPALPPREFALE